MRGCVRSIRPVVRQWSSCSESPRDPARATRDRMTEVWARVCGVRSCVSCCPLAPHGAKQSRCHRESRQKASNEAGCEQARFPSGGHIGKQWACVPKLGRSMAHQELRRRSPRPDKVTRQDGALPMRPKGKRKWGILPPRSQNQQLNNQVNEGATILFGR